MNDILNCVSFKCRILPRFYYYTHEKKNDKLNCLFCERVMDLPTRFGCLLSLEELLVNFYTPFARQVAQSYSLQEQEVLARIIRSLTFYMRGDVSEPCSLGDRCYQITFCGLRSYFRLTLPEKDPFNVQVRFAVLCDLEKRLHCFLSNQIENKPYSSQEQRVLKRIRKLLVHQLGKTPKYALFKQKRISHLTEENRMELHKQKIDETRLRIVSLYHYNPLSLKFKRLKEEYLAEVKRKYGKE